MTYRGEVHGGVVVLEAGARLPEGAVVRVEIELPTAAGSADDTDGVFEMADLAVDTGIPDLATNVDYYLYGHPKVTDGR
jgi:hypothetical protein